MQRLLLSGLCLVSASVAAQTAVTPPFYITFGATSVDNIYAIGQQNCTQTLSAQWVASEAIACSEATFWTTEQTGCGSEPAAGDVRIESVGQVLQGQVSAGTGTLSISVKDLPGFRADGGVACGAAAVEKSHRVCGVFQVPSTQLGCGSTTTPRTANAARIVYDTLAPEAPTLDSASARDGALGLAWTAPADAAVVYVEVKASVDVDFIRAQSVDSPRAEYILTGLSNDTAYDVRLVAADLSGNESPPSNVLSVTPLLSNGFWAQYRAAGGEASGGGCATSPGLLGTGALVVCVALASRKKRQP